MFAYKTPWIALLALWILCSIWWHVCKIKYLCIDEGQPALTSSKTSVFTIADGNRFRLELPGNFRLAKSKPNINANSMSRSLDTLVTYLKANPGRSMTIIGYYSLAETNATNFKNLGQARAEEMKRYLMQQGISAESLQTISVKDNLLFTAQGDSLEGGLDFAFADSEKIKTEPLTTTVVATTKEEELTASPKFRSIVNPIDLYFPLDGTNYFKTIDTKIFFDEAIQYLRENKDKKLLLTGHTDNSGPEPVNMQLSLARANVVKANLLKAGVNPDQIEVQSKGETQPKADNSTLSGRQANRRVTVAVVQ